MEKSNQAIYDDNNKLKGSMGLLISPNLYTGAVCPEVFDRSKADRGLKNRIIASYFLDFPECVIYRDGSIADQDW